MTINAPVGHGVVSKDDLVITQGEYTITGGTFTMDTADDCLHAGGDLTISSGEFTLSSGDDAVHSDGAVSIADGTSLPTTMASMPPAVQTPPALAGGPLINSPQTPMCSSSSMEVLSPSCRKGTVWIPTGI